MSQFVTEINSNEKSIMIENVQSQQQIKVVATKHDNGNVEIRGLPDEVEVNMYHYNNVERWNSF